MSELPQSEINFLFTNLESNAALWEQHPQVMPAAQARHDALIRTAVESNHGHIFQNLGDSLCAAFASAGDALCAALAIQRSFAETYWGELRLTVRVALHNGPAEMRDGEYFGPPTLNRLARILAVANPGQILLSAAMYKRINESLPTGVGVRDLGERRLRDLPAEHIYQLIATDLPDQFPALKTLDARPSNLPAQATSFIGRQQEQQAVAALLRQPEVRFVTLLGTGGTGKTRLSIQVAANLLDEYADGAWFVPLAAISDPQLVASTIAQSLGLEERAGASVTDSLKDYLRERQLLLVLDNFEQVVAAAPLLDDLLAAAPALKLLVSSREALHLTAEHEYLVPPLALPDPNHLPPADTLADYAAVTLFVQRAQAVRFDFALRAENAAAVAEICARLDGLPLAIELAAARVKLFSPAEMLMRLDNRLALLTSAVRDRSARQQSLRGMIDWSYDLLAPAERQLFARLAVFVGGFTPAAVEAVCTDFGLPILDLGLDKSDGTLEEPPSPKSKIQNPKSNVLELLSSLADKSLLLIVAHSTILEEDRGEPRFAMLETIRKYAQEKLSASVNAAPLHLAHANYYMTLVEAGEVGLQGGEQLSWLGRLEQEHDNVRAALTWALKAGEATLAQRTAAAMSRFWFLHSHLREGRDWLLKAQAQGADSEPWLQAKVSDALGSLLYRVGDWQAAIHCHEQSIAIRRAAGDKAGVGESLNNLANALYDSGDYEAARARYEESIAYFEELGDQLGVAKALSNLGLIASDAGDYPTARALFEQCLAIKRGVAPKHSITLTVGNLAFVLYAQGDYAAARAANEDCLRAYRELKNREGITFVLEGMAQLEVVAAHEEKALRLLAAAEKLRAEISVPVAPADLEGHLQLIASARAPLGEAGAALAWAEGEAMTTDQAIDYALDGAN